MAQGKADQASAIAAESVLVVESGDRIEWSEEADLVIVGFGAAGACTALEADALGQSAIIVDRFDGGGATAMSGGVVYAGETRYQKDGGVEDSVEDTSAYLEIELEGAASPAAIRRYAQDSAANLDWLASHGVPFEGTPYLEKTILPPDGFNLYYAGNEKFPANKARAKPAPRGHKTVGSGMTGHILFDALRRSVESRPITVHAHCPARRLIVDKDQRVIGIEVEALPEDKIEEHRTLYKKIIPLTPFAGAKDDRTVAAARALERSAPAKRRYIRARRGVVLATGGFEFSLDTLRLARPMIANNLRSMMRLGSLGNDGSGLALGKAVGGTTAFMDAMYLGRILSPPTALLRGVLVNRAGQRIINEDAYGGHLGDVIADQPNGDVWLILSGESFRAALWEILTGGWIGFRFYGLPALINILLGGTRRAGRIEKLARKCGIDPAALGKTIGEYDRQARSGKDDAMGKVKGYFQPLGSGSFYALRLSIGNRFAFTQMLTLGGLRISEDTGHVLRGDGSAIDGLYAAGRVAAGLCSQGYISGMSLGDCVFAARRAARHMASESPDQRNVA